jgi:class 3 adenylate cyclase
VITFDRRGTGLSDRMREAPTLESRMDDLRAVLDAAGSERAVLFATFEAASMCLLFAATYPERVLFRGRELDTAGDGFFATFDGPVRAIRCAEAITQAVRELGLEVRAGVHTGECELVDGKVAGIAVNIGARVASHAGAGEVLVSQTVKDLVAGSGIDFDERGAAELKGVPGEWRLYAVADAAA